MSLRSATVRITAARRTAVTAMVSVFVMMVSMPIVADAQRVVTQPEQVVTVAKGASALMLSPTALQRITIADPTIAEATVLAPTEVLINGRALGTTSLLMWDASGRVRLYSVEVTADASQLQRYLRDVLGTDSILVSAAGNMVSLTGHVPDAGMAIRAVEIATGTGATVIDNLTTPGAVQVLLEVRFAEVNRNVIKEWSASLAAQNPHDLDVDGIWRGSTNPEGEIGFQLLSLPGNLEAMIRYLKGRGEFRSLAEPNLLTLPGREASFLAGGEFPYPSVQAGGGNSTVTIVFKEFGIRLRFTPTIMRNGAIRLKVAPEVSSLDFANALTLQGFVIPSLLTRRAETEVELQAGQHLSIAGLLDNQTIENINKIPILGDIPILGEFFKSRSRREQRTELLVVVTPRLVQAGNAAPALPTGEPGTWQWDGFLEPPTRRPAAPAPTTTPNP